MQICRDQLHLPVLVQALIDLTSVAGAAADPTESFTEESPVRSSSLSLPVRYYAAARSAV